MSRLVVVANRLPVSVHTDGVGLVLAHSPGGLASALRGIAGQRDALWIGWPGASAEDTVSSARELDDALAAHGALPVHLSRDEIAGFYDGFANGVLWPLLHYLADRVRIDAGREWSTFHEVNARFADAVVAQLRPHDLVWVHDYQLALVPQLVRDRVPDARIGFFLHVPFPSEEVFRILPWRQEILRGILGADLVGFQTGADSNNFAAAAARVLELEPGVDALEHDGRIVRLGAFPISVDAGRFARLAREPAVRAEIDGLRARAGDQRLLLGVDRLDYTKGIPRRLLAVERLLEREPSLRGRLRLVQVAVPTRERVDAYAEFRRSVNELVGRINARFATADWVPIHFLERNLSHEELVALYAATDVMLVTPLRDGMNLVAKEFVASREDEDGVLVLSEFAGASAELGTALIVNPYDVDRVASTLATALAMPRAEQRVRMRAMRRQVIENDIVQWTRTFLEALGRPTAAAQRLASTLAPSLPPPSSLAADLARAASLCVVLDYDGTLVPLAATPELAAPDHELLGLLRTLATRPGTKVQIVSGRLREDLERWLGQLPVGLHAEHGFWTRMALEDGWIAQRPTSLAWKPAVVALLEDVSRRTVGTFVQEKTASVAWHYRTADPELAHERTRELRERLASIAAEAQLEIMMGTKVLEVRLRSIHKGLAAARIVAASRAGCTFLAIGADSSDEDIFTAMPRGAITVRVGAGLSRAAHRLRDSAAVRGLLQSIARTSPPA